MNEPYQSASDPNDATAQNEPSKGEHASSDNHAAAPPTQTLGWTKPVVVVLVFGGLIVAAQATARDGDHQIANMITGLLAVVGAGLLALLVHRRSRRKWLVPGLVVTVIATSLLLLKYEGVNGELVPQFAWRFAPRPEVRSFENTAADVGESIQAAPPGEAAFDQFLGPDRTGVLDSRGFGIPESISDAAVLWDQGVGAGWSSFAVSSGVAVTLEQRGERELVTAYRVDDGEPLWAVGHDARHEDPLGGIGPRSTPAIAGGRVYAQGATGRIWCIDLVSGATIWTVDLLAEAGWDQAASEMAITWGRSGSPLLVEAMVVVPFGGPESLAPTGRSIIALDAKSGETIYTAGSSQISYASPMRMTLGGVDQIVSVNESDITGHAIADGSTLWSFEWFGQSNAGANCSAAMPAGPNRFLIGKGYGGGSALVEVTADRSGDLAAEAIWQMSTILKTKFNHALVDGPTAYGISNGSLVAVEVDSGRRLWRQSRRERAGQGQAILCDDVLVVQNEAGDVTFVEANPNEYRELGRLPGLDHKTWNIPTVAGDRLIIRNDRRAICYRL